MHHNTETKRSTGSFRVRDGRILLFRVGPANGQVQNHNRCPRDMETGKKKEWEPDRGDYSEYIRRTPERRGIWAFPYPFQDAFLYAHVWNRHMPKAMTDGSFDWDKATEEEEDARIAAMEAKRKAIRLMLKPRLIWHGGPFYSHIRPKGEIGERNWWRYESPRAFVESARSDLWTWRKDGGILWKNNYSSDNLELFVPT